MENTVGANEFEISFLSQISDNQKTLEVKTLQQYWTLPTSINSTTWILSPVLQEKESELLGKLYDYGCCTGEVESEPKMSYCAKKKKRNTPRVMGYNKAIRSQLQDTH